MSSHDSTEAVIDRNLRLMAIRVLYLLAGRATPEFPTSTVAHPSYQVVVNRLQTSLYREGHRSLFPWAIASPVWHRVIVPILGDEKLQTDLENNAADLSLGRIEDVVGRISVKLEAKLESEGYLPES